MAGVVMVVTGTNDQNKNHPDIAKVMMTTTRVVMATASQWLALKWANSDNHHQMLSVLTAIITIAHQAFII